MTLIVEAAADVVEIDVDGKIDRDGMIRYIGKATKQFDGSWICLAAIGEALCRVEVTVKPLQHVNSDPGDEDLPRRRF